MAQLQTTGVTGSFEVAGSVGIGTTVPSYKMDIHGITRCTGSTYLATAVGGVGIKTTSLNNSTLNLNGSLGVAVTTINSTPYSATDTDFVILCDTSLGSGGTNIVVQLPTASGRTGRVYVIKKKVSGTVNSVTITGSLGNLIDGAKGLTFTTTYGSRTIVCDGTNWWVIANEI
jgi:hypothetical protein